MSLLLSLIYVGHPKAIHRGPSAVFYCCYWFCLGLQKGAFEDSSWQTCVMSDHNIKSKQSLIQQLREVAEKETAWLEKNRLLYTQKRERLDNLIRERGRSGGEVSAEEQKLSKHINTVRIKTSRDVGLSIRNQP